MMENIVMSEIFMEFVKYRYEKMHKYILPNNISYY